MWAFKVARAGQRSLPVLLISCLDLRCLDWPAPPSAGYSGTGVTCTKIEQKPTNVSQSGSGEGATGDSTAGRDLLVGLLCGLLVFFLIVALVVGYHHGSSLSGRAGVWGLCCVCLSVTFSQLACLLCPIGT